LARGGTGISIDNHVLSIGLRLRLDAVGAVREVTGLDASAGSVASVVHRLRKEGRGRVERGRILPSA